eukprot:maker-scaffold151_size306168-snap-gene-0.6 protein:Tk08765 transcript:maker-scaffold151_size306168-snap-gene-0.6-mRNA-1 annotation:"duplex-specific nuclease"
MPAPKSPKAQVIKNLQLLTMVKFCFAVLLVFRSVIGIASQSDCIIEPDKAWPAFPPIFQDSLSQFIWPTGSIYSQDRKITFVNGEQLELSCIKSTFENFPQSEFASAVCVGGDEFLVTADGEEDIVAKFQDLGCMLQPKDDAIDQGSLCGRSDEGLLIEIGFQMRDNEFATLIETCLQVAESRSIYAKHTLYPEITGRSNISANERPYYFQPDEYYGYEINDFYTQVMQKETIAELLQSQALADQYIRPDDSFYFARGHLSPNGDFVYFSHQDASFYFMNVAPQWQVFNGGNWYYLESATRDFVEERGAPLDVYSGTHGICQLADVNGVKVDLWLRPEFNQLPVPKYYWKVLHDSASSSGVAFIGVNNPYITEDEIEALKICTPLESHPILDDIFYPNDIELGILFACQVNDVDKIFEEIPDLGELSLLV